MLIIEVTQSLNFLSEGVHVPLDIRHQKEEGAGDVMPGARHGIARAFSIVLCGLLTRVFPIPEP
jgi:hypothetical protein